MSWIAWSLVALLGWAAWALLAKQALRTLTWTHLLVAAWVVYTLAFVVLLAARIDPRALASRDGLFALGAASASLVALSAFFLALRAGPVAMVAPLSSLYPALAAVLGALVLRESPTVSQWAGVALAILAGVLLTRP
jgi:bacterial/archaeal transporter family protein